VNRLCLLFIAICGGQACAQGYFDFGQVPGIADQPKVQIDLNPTMLSFVTEAARAADPESGDVIAGIDNVRVRVYETTDDMDELLEFIDDTSGRLESEGWQRTVYVDEDESKVRIYMKFENNNATGVTIMVAGDHDDEAVFINVAGIINPTQLGRLMRTIGMDEALRGVTGAGQGTRDEEPDSDD